MYRRTVDGSAHSGGAGPHRRRGAGGGGALAGEDAVAEAAWAYRRLSTGAQEGRFRRAIERPSHCRGAA
jgi:hypothetical protein